MYVGLNKRLRVSFILCEEGSYGVCVAAGEPERRRRGGGGDGGEGKDGG